MLNPNETGLFVKTYSVSLEKIVEFFNHQRALRLGRARTDNEEIIQKILEPTDVNEQKYQLRFRLTNAFSYLVEVEKQQCKQEVFDFFRFSPKDIDALDLQAPKKFIPFRYERFVNGGFLKSRIYRESMDILYIDYWISKNKRVVLLELASLKQEGLQLFDNLIHCLPVLSDSFKELSSRKTHSEKYVFKVYPMAVDLWVGEEDKFLLNAHLKNFVNASVKYYYQKEYRTSIILSSIAVESIFAELFEEAFKKVAPDIPLGGLIKQVREKVTIPEDVTSKISELNRARIASVHRSEDPVSDKDSIVSMMGITSLIMWYFNNY